MKKITRILTILLCAVIAMFAAACSTGAPDYDVLKPSYTESITAESIDEKLTDFLENCPDRTTFQEAEKKAADYIYNLLLDYGLDVAIQEMTDREIKEAAQISGVETEFNSQNVVAKYVPTDVSEKAKNVIIGAYYDNLYYKPDGTTVGGYKAEAATSNGTGVATLLAIAEYLGDAQPQLDFTVTMVFFGASAVSDVGVKIFYNHKDNKDIIANTVLMIELQRLGAEHIYAFSDARETKREAFFDNVAKTNALDVYKPTQKSPAMQGVTNLDGVPYVQWAHLGMFTTFFNNGIPTLNIVGADWETMNFTDLESSRHNNVSDTSNDTLANLKRNHPDYAKKMQMAATLVIKSLEADGFIDTMNYDKQNFPDTEVLNKEWIWYLIVVAVLVLTGWAMTVIGSRISKKYPVVMPQQRRVKMAVFGMDYEDKNSADIFLDVKNRAAQDEIFPGVPNNEATDDAPIAGVPPIFTAGSPILPELKPDNAESQAPVDSDPFADAADGSVKDVPKSEEPSVKEEAPAIDEQASNEEPAEVKTDPPDESATESKAKQAPKKSAPKKPAERKTVSAGKSQSAKKTVHTEKPPAAKDVEGSDADGENK